MMTTAVSALLSRYWSTMLCASVRDCDYVMLDEWWSVVEVNCCRCLSPMLFVRTVRGDEDCVLMLDLP